MKTYKCPKCGSEEVSVTASVSVCPTEEGVEVLGDIEWDEHDSACCLNEDCDWSGEAGLLKLTKSKH